MELWLHIWILSGFTGRAEVNKAMPFATIFASVDDKTLGLIMEQYRLKWHFDKKVTNR